MRCARLSSAFTLWDHIRGLFTFAEPKALDEDLAFHRKRQDWLHRCHFFYCRLLPVLRVKKANICCSRWSEFRSWKHESMWCHVHLLEPPDVNWYETLGDWWMLVNCTSHCACCKVWRNRIREKSTFSKAVQRDIWGYWVETDNRNIRQQALDVRKQRYIYLTLVHSDQVCKFCTAPFGGLLCPENRELSCHSIFNTKPPYGLGLARFHFLHVKECAQHEGSAASKHFRLQFMFL